MRPVPGLERPLLQWLLVGASVLLAFVVAAETLSLQRVKARTEALHAAGLNERLEREELAMRFTREQAAREALSLEVARLRGAAPAGGAGAPPTLTLSPRVKAAATPPEPTLDQPDPNQPIALRLVLTGAVDARRTYAVTLRGWSGGPMLWMRGGLAPATIEGRPMILTNITGDLLRSGAYEVGLAAQDGESGSPSVAAYEIAVR